MTVLQYDEEAARKLTELYSSADLVAQRNETLRRLPLSPGESVIDVGCGPGFLCDSMAEAVGPSGRVLGIDISSDLLEFARRRNARDWLTFRKGDAAALDVPAGSFDVAVSTQVIEYVADADRAMAEIARVLKPGGRGLIVDTDWDGVVWYSTRPERMQKVLRAWEGHCNDARLPRTLAPRLRAAGLRVENVTAFPIVNTTLTPDTYSYGLVELIIGFVRRQSLVSAQDLDAWVAEQQALNAEGRYFFSTTRHIFQVSKP